jgi:hypothetical protein
MRLVFQMLPMLFFALAGFGSEIREFDLRTIERLGNELSRRDAMAARASDLVLANHPKLKKGPLLEWVMDLSNGGSVYWIVDTEPQPTPVYKVVGGRIEDIRGRALPDAIQTRYNARRNAIKAVLPKLNAAYGAKYNFEVLNDPDGSGFLVYALAAFTRTDAIYIGAISESQSQRMGRTLKELTICHAASSKIRCRSAQNRGPSAWPSQSTRSIQWKHLSTAATCIIFRLASARAMVLSGW